METQNSVISLNDQFLVGLELIWPEGTMRSWGKEEEEDFLQSFIAAAATAATIFFSTTVSVARPSSGDTHCSGMNVKV